MSGIVVCFSFVGPQLSLSARDVRLDKQLNAVNFLERS